MDCLRVLFSLGLPWLTGALFVMAVSPGMRLPGYGACVLGMGLPLGLVSVLGGYLILGTWGPGLQFGANVAIQSGLVVVLGGLVTWRWRGPAVGGDSCGGVYSLGGWGELSMGWRWMLGLLVAWLAVRWLGIVVEVAHRPLFPWDAWYAYGINAKVWFFYPQLDVFAEGWGWLEAEGPVWGSGGTRHPPGIGLIQLWMAQGLGRWDDAWMNLVWPFAMFSVALTVFGILRMVRAGLPVAVLTGAAVVTLPVLNTQAVLAGYGDLWIASFFLVAGAAAFLARHWHRPGLLLITLVAACGMLMIKETGLAWMPVLALGILVGWARLRWVVVVGLLGVAGVFVLLWLHGEPVRVSILGHLGFGVDGFVWPDKIGLGPWREITMWPALLKHLFVIENWHLLWYLVLVAVVCGIQWLRQDHSLRVLWAMSVVGMIVLVSMFSFTTLGNSVNDGTSVNRLLLHVAPLVALLAGVVAKRLMGCLIARRWVVAG